MSKKSTRKPIDEEASPLPVENQSQRRMKYGANVVLVSVMVIALAALVMWLSQAQDLKLFGKRLTLRARPDMTSNSSNSLKPQTNALVRDLKEKVTLVSLYPRLKEEERTRKEDTYDRVLNVLDQYHQQNPDKISVMTIDPIAEPGKLDAWIGQLKRDYGQNISSYEDLLRGFPKTVEKIRANASKQFKEMRDLTQAVKPDDFKGLTDDQKDEISNTINVGIATVQQFPAALTAIDANIRTELDKKIPDYEKGKNELVSGLTQLSALSEALAGNLKKLRDDKTTPQAIRTYAEHAVPAFEELKKLSDDEIASANGLGKLKLEEVRRKLIPPDDTKSPPPAIVVMGKDDIRVIDFDSVWKNTATVGFAGNTNEKPRLRFAGEQQITRSILALSEQEKVIVIVRDGGNPLTESGSQGGDDEESPAGPLSDIAERLRSYNFKVVEKDVSAQMHAMELMQMAAQQPENQQLRMQAMQLQQRAQSEPGDDVLKDAIWVAFPMQSSPRNPEPNVALGQKLKEHLEPQPAGGDLTVDDSDASLVRSSSHSFAATDAGKTLEITGGKGWAAGRYKIVSVVSSAAKLDHSPGAVKSAAGEWEILGSVDLTVDAKDAKTIHSASRPFTDADKGDVLRIKPGGVWNPGRYKVQSVKDGAAVVDVSPAPVGTSGGAWDIAPGSAFCFTSLYGDDLAPALNDYDLQVHNHAVLMHERVEATGEETGDFIEQARRLPMVYVLNQYGEHPIVEPLNWLDSAIQFPLWVEKKEKAGSGVSVSMLVPIPQTPRTWLETDLNFLFQRGQQLPTYHESETSKPPFFAGAVAERPNCGRLVVLGGDGWDVNPLLRIPDAKMEKQHLHVSRFPANGELFTNAIFWLAGEDQMIALSPSAMETPRIASMGNGALNFWRIGVFLVGLPLAALVSGLFVYRARRD